MVVGVAKAQATTLANRFVPSVLALMIPVVRKLDCWPPVSMVWARRIAFGDVGVRPPVVEAVRCAPELVAVPRSGLVKQVA